MNPIYSRSSRLVKSRKGLSTSCCEGYSKASKRRRKVQKGGWISPEVSKPVSYDWEKTKEKKKKVTDTLIDGGPLHPGSKSVMNPQLSLFNVPPTDLSMSSYRIVPIQTYMTGINPVEFQVDPQEDYVDLSRSFFKIELALKLANGDNAVEATRLWPTNNLAHTLFKQISVRLNGTLISPQMDTYHYKAYLERMLNYNRDDGETVLKPQGWYNALDFPTELTENNTNTEGEGHEAFQA